MRRVVVHPTNPNIVYVAAVGHLFGPNKERGLYKTIDGGKTWTNTNFINEDTGFIDVVMDPKKPDVLFAASYQRRRTPHGFNGGGPDSGIWKTTNGGKTWTKLTGNGLPDGGGILGRIGLDICRTKPNVIYAQIEVGASPGTGANVGPDGKQAPTAGQAGAGRAAQAGQAAAGRPGGTRGQPQAPAPPDPKKSGVWRSDDGGKTWRVVSNTNDRPMYYSQIRVDPSNAEIVYLGGAPAFKSIDGGKTFKTLQNLAHSDHHAIWIDPKNVEPRHVRERRRPERQLRPGRDLGLHQHHGGGAVLRDQRRHAEAVLRVRRPAGQRVVVRTERRSATSVGILNSRLVPRGRRRRLLHAAGSDGLDDRVRRVAGRRRESPRPEDRADHASTSAARRPGRAGRLRSSWRRWPRSSGWRRRRPRRTSCPSRRPASRSGSSGTRRPSCRRTTRASSGSAATGCSSR